MFTKKKKGGGGGISGGSSLEDQNMGLLNFSTGKDKNDDPAQNGSSRDHLIRFYNGFDDYIAEVTKQKASGGSQGSTGKPTSSSLHFQSFNIREQSRMRLLGEMFRQVRQKKATLSPKYIILVVDQHCQKLISSYCQMYDLIEFGSIY